MVRTVHILLHIIVFRTCNYHDIDFALCCMNVLATNLNVLKFDVKFCEIKAEDFQATSSSYWPNVGVGDIEKF